MIRLSLFIGAVTLLYAAGQKRGAVTRPKPVVVPMTLTLEGTRIAGPQAQATVWRTALPAWDIPPMPAGFDLSTTTSADPHRLAGPLPVN